MAELKNNFTWSASRNGTYEWCQRKYWWNYYGSWGGWNRNSDPEVRRAYILKNLRNRWAWVGTVVHEAIEAVLLRVQQQGGAGELGFEGPPGSVDVEAELERATERMRRDWRESRNAEYRLIPKKRFGLVEHEYDEDVPKAEWQAMNVKARKALEAFLTSDLFQNIRDGDPSRWLPIEKLDQFQFEGTPVWVVLDFARQRPDGAIEIYDWKTGKIDPEGNKSQLGAYTMYVSEKYDVPIEKIQNTLVYLNNEGIHPVTFTLDEDQLRATRSFMRESIAKMRVKLSDPEINFAKRDDFPLTDDLSHCKVCSFRSLCDRVDI